MLIKTDENIFLSEAEILLCPTNLAGILHTEVEFEFFKRFATQYKEFRTVCDTGQIQLGDFFTRYNEEWKKEIIWAVIVTNPAKKPRPEILEKLNNTLPIDKVFGISFDNRDLAESLSKDRKILWYPKHKLQIGRDPSLQAKLDQIRRNL